MLLPTTTLCRIVTCVVALSQGLVLASPVPHEEEELSTRNRGFGNGMWLRIMPLGASITWGLKSSDGNGYREYLRNEIVDYGNEVNMVGSRRNGTMEDNDVEGWPGLIISQVHEKALSAVPKYKPNLILINVGTNDCSAKIETSKAGQRMTEMLDDIYKSSPQVTVILSTLLIRWDEAAQECVEDVNQQFVAAAASQRSKGRGIVVVDMQPPDGPESDELVDGTHPNDYGYEKMANIWFNGIHQADRAGFLHKKEPIAGNPDGVPDRGVYS
ncbi:carbohydrate esterase family 3 protein [Poronia punctata]|nr:carbohydrate esterase family 3 protein [Poronia punctata]